MTELLKKFFGKDFMKEQRVYYYDFIENYIAANVTDWSSPPETDKLASDFGSVISKFANEDFAFLLCHAGYIPEFYEHDSSQETLYSKLIEVLVCEWARRVGFKDSSIQKQKASKEDVTIQIDSTVVVCDAKSYRLGRSQSAPNVKDTIKKADYEKWQDWWNVSEPNEKYGKLNSIGGLITFPSLHRWKGSSDAYLYSTDKTRPIMIVFYEHLSFFIIKNYSHKTIIDLIKNYPNLFPSPSKDQHKYFDSILKSMFGDNWESFIEYEKLFIEVVKEKVVHTMTRIKIHIEESKKRIKLEIEAIEAEKLKEVLIESRLENECGQIIKQLENIKKFRPH